MVLPKVTFMPHQKAAMEQLETGNILCAGVGTGKSITALGYFYIYACDAVVWDDGRLGPMSNPADLYIITTARKRDTHEWEKECDRFNLMNDESVKVTIDSWNNLHKYENVTDAFFIFDEQRVVGSGSWVKSFLKVAQENDWILLSATPGDTWLDYIPVFIANGFYRNRTQFLRRHAVYSRYTQFPKITKWLEVPHLERLRQKITVTMLYDKKTEAHWKDIFVNYDEKMYNSVTSGKEFRNPWTHEVIDDIAAVCYALRKVVNVDPRRMKAAEHVISQHPKVIIFYNFDYELEELRKLKDICSIDVAEWNGHKHESIPDSNRWAYLVQYTAGCEGWNCIETDTIIFYSQSYSYKQMTQAAGRIDRMNTPFVDLYYYLLKSKAPIDMAIAKALKGKRNFNEKNFISCGSS